MTARDREEVSREAHNLQTRVQIPLPQQLTNTTEMWYLFFRGLQPIEGGTR